MKLVTCEVRAAAPTKRLLGALISESEIVDLEAAHAAAGRPRETLPGDMLSFLAAGDPALAAARSALDYAVGNRRATSRDGSPLIWSRTQLRLLPAVPRPGKILHTSVNFSSHKTEVTKFKSEEWKAQNWGAFHYKHPTGFLQAPSSTVGTDAEVVIPRFTEQLDYEIEIATVIGRRAKNVSKENALDYVAGFCVFNDISARDIQSREHANKVILLGKSFDTSCPLGPWLTTRDEIPDPEHLQMQLRLNGELRQDANTSEMIYGIRELVSWWSQITLEPGDVITSGSPAGVIAGRDDAVWLKPGDRIEATIERLGTLVSTIAAEKV
ncbi:MAG TPA: fumarylacetoacetate hydrolase family protein [Casimicrobiaceae bacterium]|nr:fumarylacetoacetate hydrolase family protein [Casimicrobiaceae bacterium]